MVFRIEIVSEVADWLGDLRESEPLTARLVDEAVGALARTGTSLGSPLVVRLESVWNLAEALDEWYQDRFERLLDVRSAMVAADEEVAAAHDQQSEQVRRAKEVRAKHDRMQANTDLFRVRKERLKVGYDAAEAAGRVAEVAELLGEPIPGHERRADLSSFKVLRPARVGARELRIVFVMEPDETAVLLYGADSEQEEQDWLSEAVPEILRRYRSHMNDRWYAWES